MIGGASRLATDQVEAVDYKAPIASKMDGWTECFQDLRSWCHSDQDELHTPQFTSEYIFNQAAIFVKIKKNIGFFVVQQQTAKVKSLHFLNNDYGEKQVDDSIKPYWIL